MDGFFPKCYDLYDQQDLEDFLGIYYIFRGVQVLLCAVPDDLIAQGGAEQSTERAGGVAGENGAVCDGA